VETRKKFQSQVVSGEAQFIHDGKLVSSLPLSSGVDKDGASFVAVDVTWKPETAQSLGVNTVKFIVRIGPGRIYNHKGVHADAVNAQCYLRRNREPGASTLHGVGGLQTQIAKENKNKISAPRENVSARSGGADTDNSATAGRLTVPHFVPHLHQTGWQSVADAERRDAVYPHEKPHP
jgi:hypothetical protein